MSVHLLVTVRIKSIEAFTYSAIVQCPPHPPNWWEYTSHPFPSIIIIIIIDCTITVFQIKQNTISHHMASVTLCPFPLCFLQCTMCRMGSFKCVRLKSDADSSKFPEFFSHSKKFSVSDFTRTHFLIFEKKLVFKL